MRDTMARRRGDQLEDSAGFTLIELLIVIVVLGILAATVIFALSGVTGQSAQAACISDGKTYEVAVAAYENTPLNTTNAAPANTNDLLVGGTYGQMLHQAANNSHYVVAVTGDTVTNNTTGVNNGAAGTTIGATTGAVWVGVSGQALTNYDLESQGAKTGCFAVS
jgi:general secretion pathway protein G